MKRLKSVSRKGKIIFAVSVLGVAALAIGGAIAYSQDRAELNNKFTLLKYNIAAQETFDSPSNWSTCETTPKEFVVTNNSNATVSVRLALDESWKNRNNAPMSLYSEKTGLRMAIINFNNNSGWTKDGRYYYYDTDLAPGASTTSLISSVTFNCDADLTVDTDYVNVTYKLRLTAETIAAEQNTEWRGMNLYNAIAAKTLGVDRAMNVQFDEAPGANDTGVLTEADSSSGQYPIYYYRGMVEDNFAIWNNKCWRIIRTTATGGVRLLFNNNYGNYGCSTNGQLVETAGFNYNDSNNSALGRFGYMYETNVLANNMNDSLMKTRVDAWFKDNMLAREDDLEDDVFCNDRRIWKNDSSLNDFYYTMALYRLTNYGGGQYYRNIYGNYGPSLDCETNDSFTRSTANGNGMLKYPAALITADEVTLAGACYNYCSIGRSTRDLTSYLANAVDNYYTMTPWEREDMFIVYASSTGAYYKWLSDRAGVRPVVSLKQGTLYTRGDGTVSSPYIIE